MNKQYGLLMNRLLLVFCLLVLVCGGSACLTDPVSSTVTAGIISDRLKYTTDRLSASIEQAMINSDYLLEKNLRRLELVGHALTGRLKRKWVPIGSLCRLN